MNEAPKRPRGGLPQLFNYNGQSWDVDKALRLVVGRRPDLLLVDEALVDQLVDLDVDREWALAHADPSDPVVVIPLPAELFGSDAGDLVIDGWHRIVRAANQGLRELPAHFLTADDERRCRHGETLDGLASHEPWYAPRVSWGESGANRPRR